MPFHTRKEVPLTFNIAKVFCTFHTAQQPWELNLQCFFFGFWGKFLSLNNKRKYSATHAKDFCENKAPKLPDFKEKIVKSPFLHNMFQHIPKSMTRFLRFSTFLSDL
jgi:membrane associated rhomboid family serine protease